MTEVPKPPVGGKRRMIAGMRKELMLTVLAVAILVSNMPVGCAWGADTDYMLYENHGGTWCDAEKRPGDDGEGNPPPVDPGEEDDLLCWAATASNVLEWTGWGYVSGWWNTDEMFQNFQDYWYDRGGWMEYAWNWWFDGTDPGGGRIDVPGGGNFWPSATYPFGSYFYKETDGAKAMDAIDEYLHNGYGVGIAIFDGGHAITVWGFRYDPAGDKAAHTYYKGIWVTDSDDNKGSMPPAPNRLRYYDIEWDAAKSKWKMWTNWWITDVQALAPFPSGRPVAASGGPYIGYEGSPITFDGSGSSDPEGDALNYRWDFDNNEVWDTAWSATATASHTWYEDYTGTALLQVYSFSLSDVDTTTVTVLNVAPTVNAGPDQTVDEGDTVSFSGSFTDPGTSDTHTISWDFGDGSTAVTGTLTPTHAYGDDGVYTVTLTVTDDDGGVGTDTLTVTVNNVAPTATIDTMSQPNPQFILPIVHTLTFTGSFTDPGWLDTHDATWDFGDGTIIAGTLTEENEEPDATGTATGSHSYSTPGTYTVTLTITDDDGGSGTDTYEVVVASAEEAKEDIITYILGLPDGAFKGNPMQRKTAFSNMFRAIDDMLDDQEYNGVIKDLRNNVRSKADGQVDGDPKNDWIIDPTAQDAICEKIDDLTAYLETLL